MLKIPAPGCTNPMPAWQPVPGSEAQRRIYRAPEGENLRYFWGEPPQEFKRFFKPLHLPCGQCLACRHQYASEWSARIMCEATLYERNCFVTLTYAPEHLPEDGSLVKKDIQDFKKRLRSKFSGHDVVPGVILKPNQKNPIRTYEGAEYGERFSRPHYHLCILNFKPFDLLTKFNNSQGQTLYTSKSLETLWGKGFVTVGELTAESADYVARYVMKKVNGKEKNEHYRKIDPETGELIFLQQEFATMSRKPGIGIPFFEKYKSDFFDGKMTFRKQGKVVRRKTPKHFETVLARTHPEIVEQLKQARKEKAESDRLKNPHEYSPDRMAVKAKVYEATVKSLKRKGNI